MNAVGTWEAFLVAGAGGASRAFLAREKQRIIELQALIGYAPYPGTLNLRLKHGFDWDAPHVQGSIWHASPSGGGLRGVRLYPVALSSNNIAQADCMGHVIRFENASYPDTYIGVIAPVRLRELFDGKVTLCLR